MSVRNGQGPASSPCRTAHLDDRILGVVSELEPHLLTADCSGSYELVTTAVRTSVHVNSSICARVGGLSSRGGKLLLLHSKS